MTSRSSVGHTDIDFRCRPSRLGCRQLAFARFFRCSQNRSIPVQKRTVFWATRSPEYGLRGPPAVGRLTLFVVGSVIHDHNQPLVGKDGKCQIFQKGNEGFAVFLRASTPGNVAELPMVSPENMAMQRCAGAGMRWRCPRFIQQRRKGGCKLRVVSSRKRSWQVARSVRAAFFNQSNNLLGDLLRRGVLQVSEVVFGLSPDIVQLAHQRSKAGIAQQDASLLMRTSAVCSASRCDMPVRVAAGRRQGGLTGVHTHRWLWSCVQIWDYIWLPALAPPYASVGATSRWYWQTATILPAPQLVSQMKQPMAIAC